MIAELVGGIGLFLLGMLLMTDGLKTMAGDSLRQLLARFTGGPIKALLTGTAVTAVVQSSSATTLMTIGFVSAGLLTFPQALGVIFGTNIGTTSTSWLVAVIGLKFSVSAVALPVIGVGAMMRLLGSTRVAAGGTALAGFGLIFVGIDTLQLGMAGVAERIDPGALAGPGIFGRLILVFVGMVMTVVMQSSSAATATTLTALHGGAVDLEQAAALVIGQNLGTTVKAGIAAIGASIPAKRTALGHILFNVLTGVIAFALLPLFVLAVSNVAEGDTTTALAAFHTIFNFLGVLIFLPFIGRFAAWIERIIPETTPELTRNLDQSVLAIPAVAVEAARGALTQILRHDGLLLRAAIRDGKAIAPGALDEAHDALKQTRRFIARIARAEDDTTLAPRLESLFHVLDHCERLTDTGAEGIPPCIGEEETTSYRREFLAQLDLITEDPLPTEAATRARQLSERIASRRREDRPRILREGALGAQNAKDAFEMVDTLHWIDRAAFHVYRALHHLSVSGADEPELPALDRRTADLPALGREETLEDRAS